MKKNILSESKWAPEGRFRVGVDDRPIDHRFGEEEWKSILKSAMNTQDPFRIERLGERAKKLLGLEARDFLVRKLKAAGCPNVMDLTFYYKGLKEYVAVGNCIISNLNGKKVSPFDLMNWVEDELADEFNENLEIQVLFTKSNEFSNLDATRVYFIIDGPTISLLGFLAEILGEKSYKGKAPNFAALSREIRESRISRIIRESVRKVLNENTEKIKRGDSITFTFPDGEKKYYWLIKHENGIYLFLSWETEDPLNPSISDFWRMSERWFNEQFELGNIRITEYLPTDEIE